jgi:dienelactone hydrolase
MAGPSFDCDRAQPLDPQEYGVEQRAGVAIHDVSYAGVAHGRVEALLITPPDDGTYPGVIYVHAAQGNRYSFVDEAVELALHGAVSLLIDAPWSRAEAWGRTLGEPEHARRAQFQTAQNLRRGIDVLTGHPQVDPEYVAFVGHGLGALFGGILAGVEERLTTFVLMAGVGSFSDVAAVNLPELRGAALERYRQVLAPIDPLGYVQWAAPSPILFQFGLLDRSYPRERFVEYAAAGSEPKLVKWYCTDSDLPDPAARRDRIEWLQWHLKLDSDS